LFISLSITVFIAFLIKIKTTPVDIGSTIINENDMGYLKNLLIISILCWIPVCFPCFISAVDKTVHPSVIGFVSVFVVPLKSAVNPYSIICPLAYTKWIQFKNGN
jgi:hypothetical protein